MIHPAEFQARREQLLKQLLPNSIAIIPAAQEVTRSNDTEYHFRQNSDFFYLSGFNEPDAFLVLSNAMGASNHHDTVRSAMFVRPKDDVAEVWQGRRIGVNSAPQVLQVDIAYSIDELDELLPELLNGHTHLYFSLDQNIQADHIVQSALAYCRKAPKQSLLAPNSIYDVNTLIHAMRLIKSEAELALMQQSADISSYAHCQAMQICQPGMYEYQLEATLLHNFAMYGARFAAYNSIVGGGNNACILHYTENQDVLNDGDLVLIDAGSEFHGYAADITRTFPVNGKFSPAQTQLYELVLNTQLACIEQFKAGTSIAEVLPLAVKLITQGLLDLDILLGNFDDLIASEAYKSYFMHGLGHYLGLDVHDVGDYKTNGQHKALEAGMVITVEPGVYIPANAKVPEQFKGIGIRIEDNIVITPNGNKVLTHAVPKTISDIEALMASN